MSIFTIKVLAANKLQPIVDAGIDLTQRLPNSSVSIVGSATDPDGTIASYLWTQIAGPTMSLLTPTNPILQINGLLVGTYQFKLTATDDDGLTGDDTMQLIVTGLNIAPVAIAGSDDSITLPISEYQLAGSGTDADGTIVAYSWRTVSFVGAGGNIQFVPDNQSQNPIIKGMTTAGVYAIELTVTDNDGDTGTDIINITVGTPANVAPVINSIGAMTSLGKYLGKMQGTLDISDKPQPWDFTAIITDVDAHDVSVVATLVRTFDMSTVWTDTVNVVGGNGNAVFAISGLTEMGQKESPEEYEMTLVATDAGALTDTEVRTFSIYDKNDETPVNGGMDLAVPEPLEANGCWTLWEVNFVVPAGQTGSIVENILVGTTSGLNYTNLTPGTYGWKFAVYNSGTPATESSVEINSTLSGGETGQLIFNRTALHSANYDEAPC